MIEAGKEHGRVAPLIFFVAFIFSVRRRIETIIGQLAERFFAERTLRTDGYSPLQESRCPYLYVIGQGTGGYQIATYKASRRPTKITLLFLQKT